MTDIDYAALAKAACAARFETTIDLQFFAHLWAEQVPQASWEDAARAVVAAYDQQLRDQGFVVVPQTLVDAAIGMDAAWPASSFDSITARERLRVQVIAYRAALAAPGDGGEG